MFLLLQGNIICAASNFAMPAPSPAHSLVQVVGDTRTFVWPNGCESRCLFDGKNILANPAYPPFKASSPINAGALASLLVQKQASGITQTDIDALGVT